MDTPQEVYVSKVAPDDAPAVADAVEAMFARLPAAGCLAAGSRVLLKPNLLAKHPPAAGVTTHPDVVRAVVLALHKRGVRDITLADSPGGPYTPAAIKSLYEACGMADVCAALGVKLYTDCETVVTAGPGQLVKSFTLLRPVAECDFLINLPKLKTHVLTGMSGAVKNLFGCVPGFEKAEFHARFPAAERFTQMLVDLCETVKPDITIVDGILAMEGDGPSGGEIRTCGLLFAGEDPYALDLALARHMGLPTSRLPIVQAAIQSGLCAPSFDEALLIGEAAAKEPIAGFVPPRSYDGPLNMLVSLPAPLRFIYQTLSDHFAPRPVVRKARCIGCGKCAAICPQKVITLKKKKAVISRAGCIRCFCCHEMCPVKAIDVHRSVLFR